MLNMETINNAKTRIWGAESYRVTIVYEISTQRFYAECEDILTTKRLTLNNYERVLNDMFYDYCVENASWMGMS